MTKHQPGPSWFDTAASAQALCQSSVAWISAKPSRKKLRIARTRAARSRTSHLDTVVSCTSKPRVNPRV
eukprot:10337898-Alexandrium_andersonii.AAC.1